MDKIFSIFFKTLALIGFAIVVILSTTGLYSLAQYSWNAIDRDINDYKGEGYVIKDVAFSSMVLQDKEGDISVVSFPYEVCNIYQDSTGRVLR